MDISIFISLLFVLQCLYWVVGRASSKNVQGQEEYFLASKEVRFFPLMMTFLATQVGGGLVLGASDEAYRFGWPVLLYPFGASLGLLVLGLGVGKMLSEFKVSTVAEILEVVYRSKALRRIASLLSVLSLFMILVAQIIASNKFLISLGFSNMPLFILFWAIVIIYTAQGGLKAVISTDIVQAGFFSLIFLFSLGFVLYLNPMSTMLLDWPSVEMFSAVSSKLSGWLFMPLLFMLIEQDMGQRCFAGKSSSVVSKAALFAGLSTMAVCIVPVFFGCMAKSMNMEIPEGASVLMVAITKMTNPWLSALVGCAVLAAVISTATSLINAISSNLSSDFALAVTIRTVQWGTGLISILAIFFAFYFDNIVDLLIQSYELSVVCLFVPICVALFKKEGRALSAWLSILLGVCAFIMFRIYPIALPRELVSIACSCGGYLIGELFVLLQARAVERVEEN